jgi:hypothetical protein
MTLMGDWNSGILGWEVITGHCTTIIMIIRISTDLTE